MRRLADKLVPLGASISGTQNYPEKDESPGGSSSLVRWFLENSRKHEKYTKAEYMHPINHTFQAINNTK